MKENPDGAVTPRELYAHLERVYDRVGLVDDRIADVELKVERRFGRMEKLTLALGVAVAVPKLGGPDVSSLATAVVSVVFG